jgi:hypothetical protein
MRKKSVQSGRVCQGWPYLFCYRVALADTTLHNSVQAGATLQHNLEPASIVMGIKEVPLNELVTAPPSTLKDRRRTHLMFSHTAKGQSYNLPLLSRFLNEDGARLIDYELIMGEGGKRAVGFGWFAGGRLIRQLFVSLPSK